MFGAEGQLTCVIYGLQKVEIDEEIAVATLGWSPKNYMMTW